MRILRTRAGFPATIGERRHRAGHDRPGTHDGIVTHVGHDRRVGADPASISKRHGLLGTVALLLDGDIDAVASMRVSPGQDHGMRADEDMVTDDRVVQIARVADPDVVSDAGAWVLQHHSRMQDHVAPDARQDTRIDRPAELPARREREAAEKVGQEGEVNPVAGDCHPQ